MEIWLPIFFAAIMGLALLIYVVLDGYDLGIGMLIPFASEDEKDMMIASIGPFWDANETWLVLGIGILLIAFPGAHGIILSTLYLPVTLMLMGLILRGIAFDFRVKAGAAQRRLWNFAFSFGSLLTATSQGWMLGSYITGLDDSHISLLFSILLALTFPALYIMLGAAWLLIKMEGALLGKSIQWAKQALLPFGVSLLLISVATPLVSSEIASRWFILPNAIGLFPIPLISSLIFAGLFLFLHKHQGRQTDNDWLVYAGMIVICLLAATGLAYSLYPDIIIGQISIQEAAASTDSLLFTFWGTAITLPLILCYTVFVYRVFRGKATQLSYE